MSVHAQTGGAATPPAETAPASKGTVLFQSHGERPLPAASAAAEGVADGAVSGARPTGPELTDAERGAITFTAYDLDARIQPAASHLSMRARITVRNDSSAPLTRVALQISSTLNWDSVTLNAAPIAIAQHVIDTDADHTGRANELVLALPRALAAGASVTLDAFYSGPVPASPGRLERLGASAAQAADADWDGISAAGTLLRGFGNVLWYPVAARQLFLGQGAELFQAIGASRLREETASMRLRVAVEYVGEAPAALYFCGRRQALHALSDNSDAPIATGTGIATAEFAAEALGFREPSLLVVDRQELLIAPLPEPAAGVKAAPESSSSSAAENQAVEAQAAVAATEGGATGAPMLAVETGDEGSLPLLAASAQRIAPLLQEWFGVHPLSALTIVDHEGQPFEDGPLLVAPVSALAASTASPALAHSLTHAWVQTGQPWMDEGLAQFTALLWTEREQGRDAAVLQLTNLLQPLLIAEPTFDPPALASAAHDGGSAGESLMAATDELYYRRKAAAVWWMLRGIAGDGPLRDALSAWRSQALSHQSAEGQALGFERLLEKTSGKDLGWFFNDWVVQDRGLPDLSIVDVTPRELPAGKGHDTGWLVAVTVRNDGAAAVEVPVVIRSGTFSTTKRLRIDGFSTATDRVLVEAAPTEVVVNDGSIPEMRTSMHSRVVVPKPAGLVN